MNRYGQSFQSKSSHTVGAYRQNQTISEGTPEKCLTLFSKSSETYFINQNHVLVMLRDLAVSEPWKDSPFFTHPPYYNRKYTATNVTRWNTNFNFLNRTV